VQSVIFRQRISILAGFCIWLISSAGALAQQSMPADVCLYLPPSIGDRVVFYDGFELATMPEINRINAISTGARMLVSDGFAGRGCRSTQPQKTERPLEIHSPALSPSHPLTIMRWWRVDAPMVETSSFQLLALLGKGHVSFFIRGKGEWCALKRPTMYVQVDGVPSIANVNRAVRDNAYFQPGDWHHVAITVANGSEITFFLDGQPLTTVHAQGRQFAPEDMNTLQGSNDAGRDSEHPTTTDELIVIDRVLSPSEIWQYYFAALKLREMRFPPIINAAK
jgi:hypothetical protein